MTSIPVPLALRERVEARDRLVTQAERLGQALQEKLMPALARRDLGAARDEARDNQAQLAELTESLRIYQAELRAQAEELAVSQVRTEQVLTRFAALFSAMPLPALLVGANGELLEFNPAAGREFELDLRVGAARFMHRLVEPGQYQSKAWPAFHAARSGGGSTRVDELEFVGIGGRRFIGELHVSRMPSAVGDNAGFVCVVIDRTEHLQDLRELQAAHEAMRASEAFLADSARLARVGGWELTLHPQRWRASDELRTVLGEAAAEAEPLQALLSRLTPASRIAFEEALHAAGQRGRSFELELDLVLAGRIAGAPGALAQPMVAAGAAGAAGAAEEAQAAAQAALVAAPAQGAAAAADSAAGPAPYGEHLMRLRALGHPDLYGGRVVRVSGVLQDITAQHRARQHIGELNARLEMAHAAGGIGVFDWEPDDQRLLLDTRAAQLLATTAGLAPESLDLGTLLRTAVRPEEAERLATALQSTLQEATPLNLELRRHDGDERWLQITGRLQRAGAGERGRRLVGCIWDSSPAHEAERLRADRDAAESASRAKSAFLSRMSHQLRTPLNAVLGFAQIMRMEAERGDLVLKPHRVSLIETAARHLLELVNEVLDVTRIESGQVRIVLVEVDLAEIVAECLPMVQGLAEQRGVRIVRRLVAEGAQGGGPGRWLVHADRLRLKEVLINLLANAVKYHRAGGGCVEIAAQVAAAPPVASGGPGDALPGLAAEAPGFVDLIVTDDGPGINAARQAELFQPFSRAGAEASGIEGSGMGLFVSRRFVEAMGGRLELASSPPQGTTVRLTLRSTGR